MAALFAREGADVTIVYLPVEDEDAQETKKLVEKEGRGCLLFPGDLRDRQVCKGAVDKHVERYETASHFLMLCGTNWSMQIRTHQHPRQQRLAAVHVQRPRGDRPRHSGRRIQDEHHPDVRDNKVRAAAYGQGRLVRASNSKGIQDQEKLTK